MLTPKTHKLGAFLVELLDILIFVILRVNSSFIDQVLAPMTCLGGQKFRVYTRYTMPMRYHYTRSSRIGEIVIDSTAGGRVFVDQKSLKEHGPMEKGDHGYDNRMREMRAIFGAWGPSIKNGYQIETFQNIELYNLFTVLMQLPFTAPNNGTMGRLHSLLKSPPPVEKSQMIDLEECEGARLVKCGDGCKFNLNYPSNFYYSATASSSKSEENKNNNNNVPIYNSKNCKYPSKISIPSKFFSVGQMCLLRLCNATLVYNRYTQMANFVETQMTAPIPNIDHRANCTVFFDFSKGNLGGRIDEKIKNGEGDTQVDNSSHFVNEGVNNGGRSFDVKRSTTTSMEKESTPPENLKEQEKDLDDIETDARDSDPTVLETDSPEPWNRQAESEMNGNSGENKFLEQNLNGISSQQPTFPTQPTTNQQNSDLNKCAIYEKQASINNNFDSNDTPLSTTIISIFSDDDYARYILQGQFRVPIGFYNGVWKQIQSLTKQYVQHYRHLLMWSGPIFDHNNDGIADEIIIGGLKNANKFTPIPSHIFLILLRCSNSSWNGEGRQCEDLEQTRTLAFVLPIVEKDLNCLFSVEYIFRHTTRIRDIELLTGNEWFVDYPQDLAIQLRTNLNEELWQLELEK
uniref:Uncharacterized protein n=1 Tax=Meloidogyne enterolobii TaxID=390850 RepID=A0A6V7VCD0_MELEN|nr:unnamed protein product [Meloidogyne enterolobii]